MFFQTRDEIIRNMEKKIDDLEKQINRTLSDVSDALTAITDVITKMEEENKNLRKDKNLILEKQKKISKDIMETGIKKDIKSCVIEPVKNIVGNNFAFVQEVAKEGMEIPSAGSLLKLVKKEGEVEVQDAASKMKVHPVQIEHWADMLKNQKLLLIAEKRNRKYLSSINMVKR